MSASAVLAEVSNSCRVLNAELVEIENAISHLVRSNAELAAALVEAPEDPDFQEAIEENIATIASKRKDLAARREILAMMPACLSPGVSLACCGCTKFSST